METNEDKKKELQELIRRIREISARYATPGSPRSKEMTIEAIRRTRERLWKENLAARS